MNSGVKTAVSFEVRPGNGSNAVARIQAAFSKASRSVRAPSAGLIFCSGNTAKRLPAIAEAVADGLPHDFPMLIVSGPGVLSERGEIEAENAATGLVWSGPRATLASSSNGRADRDSVIALLAAVDSKAPTLLFVRSEGFDPDALWEARARCENPRIFGAGTHGDPGIMMVANGVAVAASAASLTLPGLALPVVKTAHSCRLLHPLMRITRRDGALVLELDGQPALSRLERIGSKLEGRPLLFTVLARSTLNGGDLLVRGIHGVDPDRRGLLVGNEIDEDTYMTFGIKEASAARLDLESTCRTISREIAGGAPRFGLYFNCSGRGRSLHGAPDVDCRIIRERFPDLPLGGLQSAFEIAPFESKPALQLYTGVLSVFSSPS